MGFIVNGSIDTEWEQLNGFDRYLICLLDGEICIKNKETNKKLIPKENQSSHTKAFTLIDNNNKHHNYTDSTIYNMHYKLNNKHIRDYDFITDLPDNAVCILRYKNHWFKDYYYANDEFYYDTGANFRILPKHKDTKNSYYVYARNINNKNVRIYINVWDKNKGF